ncbi:amidohydrolase [Hortaea werneckii]|nr:amidohydrolase [Hortaea werneckii]KAI7109298.1 amidohydrolase [Hortaea werneckii]KAI7238032.1 amidohydrolase [Hortaea werneckii]KAI7330014.1 amidohydrolase [Hortaea werneckii]KAI7405451.1 amidohydrolase [Hortaea werneckii]
MLQESNIKPWLRPAPRSLSLINANVIDVVHGTVRENSIVTLVGGFIESIEDSSQANIETAQQRGNQLVDCRQNYVCPGLIDCHVHLMAVPGFADLSKAFANPNDVSVLRQPYVCAQMLRRGFTSVRDCGGAMFALKEAIEDGVFPGPRLFIAGHALSQSGGHADFRNSHDHSMCCGGTTTGLGRVCNGVSECMQAVREEIRSGSDFIKIMGSGGVSSPTDKIDHLQFTGPEIRAMAECAANANTYITAHAYTSRAIRHCIDNGARGIEHGNFLDQPTAKLMAEKGCFLTPTLVAYAEMASDRWQGYLPIESATKNTEVLHSGLGALKTAADAGVTICFGTDLLGPLGEAQPKEFAIRSQVLSSLAVLQSATINAARLVGCSDYLGQAREGYSADLLLLAQNPLEDIKVLDSPETNILAVFKEGRVQSSKMKDLKEDGVMPVRLRSSL